MNDEEYSSNWENGLKERLLMSSTANRAKNWGIDDTLFFGQTAGQRFSFVMFAYSWFHFSFDMAHCFGKMDDSFVQNLARLATRNRRVKIFYDKILDNSDKKYMATSRLMNVIITAVDEKGGFYGTV